MFTRLTRLDGACTGPGELALDGRHVACLLEIGWRLLRYHMCAICEVVVMSVSETVCANVAACLVLVQA